MASHVYPHAHCMNIVVINTLKTRHCLSLSLNTQILITASPKFVNQRLIILLFQSPTNTFKLLLILHYDFHDVTLWIHDINLFELSVRLDRIQYIGHRHWVQ